MTTEKQSPSELGCLRPYTLAAKGRLDLKKASAAHLHAYLEAYESSARRLLGLILGWWKKGGDHQIVATLLVCPSRIDPKVLASGLWQKTEGVASVLGYEDWHHFADCRIYQFLRGMAGVEGRQNAVAKAVKEFLRRVALPKGLMPARTFAAIFDVYPSELLRAEIAEDVAGFLKSHFSKMEIARSQSEANAATLSSLRTDEPRFFDGLEVLLQSQAAWRRACRILRPVRQKLLREDNIPAEIVNACQLQAVLQRPEFISWQPAEPVSDAVLARAQRNAVITKRILKAFPASPSPDGIQVDALHRGSFRDGLKGLEWDVHTAMRLLQLYHRTVATFSKEEQAELFVTEKVGERMRHSGWKKLMNAKAGDRLSAAKAFFTNQVEAFVEALRPVREPNLDPQKVRFWPMFGEGTGWKLLQRQPDGVGNAIEIELHLPAHGANPVRVLTTRLRGNVAFAKAAPLSAPLDIRDGPYRFRPNQTLAVDGDTSRKTFLKPQALRVTAQGSQLFGNVTTKSITETVRKIDGAESEASGGFAAGERIAVFHLRPGGMRLGTLTLFERGDARWKIVSLCDAVARSDEGAFARDGSRTIRVHNVTPKFFSHLHFELNHLALAIDHQMAKLRRAVTESGSFKESRMAVASLAPVKSALGDVWLRRVAHRVGRILAEGRVGRMVVAGNGPISTRDGHAIPVRRFFTHESSGARRVPVGHLATAAQKAGVTIHVVTSRFALVDSKNYSLGENDREVAVGLPYRFVRRDEETQRTGNVDRTRFGTPTHLFVPACTDRLIEFPRNAAESILLGWSDEKFRALALSALESIDTKTIVLPTQS